MPPKRGQYKLTKGQQIEIMARKREERAAKAAYRKEQKMQSYLADDENYGCFATQLMKMGLQIRDIPGDGNCLFRALGDQLEGHGRNHMTHRLDVVQYMEKHREKFEPFVAEDDVPFDTHLALLRKIGTYAGNDAIVAFAQLHKVVVVIHQLNTPCWQIHGTDDHKSNNAQQLHLTYHNGEHYSSVRRIGDNTESPATIGLQFCEKDTENGPTTKGKKSASTNTYNNTYYQNTDVDCTQLDGIAQGYRLISDIEQHIMEASGCQDISLVRQTYEDQQFEVEPTIDFLVQIVAISTDSASLNPDDTASICSQPTSADSGIWSDISPTNTKKREKGDKIKNKSTDLTTSGAKPKIPQQLKISNRERKELAKKERKKRSEDKHKKKAQGLNDEFTEDRTMMLTKSLGMVQI